jgi:hypothetical protein
MIKAAGNICRFCGLLLPEEATNTEVVELHEEFAHRSCVYADHQSDDAISRGLNAEYQRARSRGPTSSGA